MNGFKAGEDAPEMTDIDIMRYFYILIVILFINIFQILLRGCHTSGCCVFYGFSTRRGNKERWTEKLLEEFGLLAIFLLLLTNLF